jgi:hypothetical protein
MRRSHFGLFGLIAASALMVGCTREVPPASVGIRFNASSGLSEKLVRPQVLWVGPRDQLIIYPTSIHNATYTKNTNEGERTGDDSIPASTMEGSILPVDMTVSYHVEPQNVLKAFQNFGSTDLPQIQRIFIRWAAAYSVNIVSGRHSIFDLTSKDRANFGREVKDVLAPILDAYGITVDDCFIGEVYPNEAVRTKVQERISMKNGLELAKLNLQRARIDSQTTLTNAKKEAELNALLASQGEKTLQLKRLELQRMAIERWNGKPAIVGDSAIPFTDIQVK